MTELGIGLLIGGKLRTISMQDIAGKHGQTYG